MAMDNCTPNVLPQRTLMLLGKTGAGKSSLGNAILSLSGGADSFTVTDGFCSTAVYSAQARQAEVHGQLVKVVDTPGLMDTSPDGEEKVVEGICDGVAQCSDGVDAFLIVLKLGHRLTEEEWKTVDKLEEMFGKQFWGYSIVVFTHGDCIANDGNTFEKQVDEAKAKIPQLQKLFEQVQKKPILVDASRQCQVNVASDQVRKMLETVEMMATSNAQKKYTNVIFAAAKSIMFAKSAALEKQLQEVRAEIRELRQRNDQLESMAAADKRQFESLEDQAKDIVARLDRLILDAAAKARDALKRKCRCGVM